MSAANAPSGKGYTQCFMFDMVDDIPGTADMLRDILEDDAIVKVLHDCRQDAAALKVQAGIELKTIFDTQARPAGLSVFAYLPVCLPALCNTTPAALIVHSVSGCQRAAGAVGQC